MNKYASKNKMKKKSLLNESLFSYIRKTNSSTASNIVEEKNYFINFQDNNLPRKKIHNRTNLLGGVESTKHDNQEFLIKETFEDDSSKYKNKRK